MNGKARVGCRDWVSHRKSSEQGEDYCRKRVRFGGARPTIRNRKCLLMDTSHHKVPLRGAVDPPWARRPRTDCADVFSSSDSRCMRGQWWSSLHCCDEAAREAKQAICQPCSRHWRCPRHSSATSRRSSIAMPHELHDRPSGPSRSCDCRGATFTACSHRLHYLTTCDGSCAPGRRVAWVDAACHATLRRVCLSSSSRRPKSRSVSPTGTRSRLTSM